MEALQKLIESMSADLKEQFKMGLSSVEAKLESTQSSIDATANSLQSLNAWRNDVYTQVSDLTVSMQ